MKKTNRKSFYTGAMVILFIIGLTLKIKFISFISLITISSLIFFYSTKIINENNVKLWCLSIATSTFMIFGDLFPLTSNKPLIVAAIIWLVINSFGLYKAVKISK